MKSVFKQCAMLAALAYSAGSVQAAEKVIFDTDFNVLNDDGQAFIMLAQLHSQKRIELLGMTLVTGNAWVDQEQVDALKAVERMGVEKDVGVYSGAVYPLLHNFATYPQEQALFGAGFPGAFKSARPTSAAQLISPPDGLAIRTDIIAEQLNSNLAELEAMHPMQRVGNPAEVANAICWLLANESSFVTGHVLNVDGGFQAK
ncbi:MULTISPECIES: SDR family oxidoreductase [Pseudomonas syringae group]|uniref:SDR family oxidoreductase n=1 Tax=Pseudomonas syringae group TaxID=136849 RepID=UPI0006E68F54|nr:SDR family oxidoreductase [Pseudomonas coronafaciens]KPX30008.1 Inosine/uridine-preferring nucleoside hydrolase [Pseudomonas coronafaciens pv. garcae]RMV82823.1 Inosine/uridine-preferring nucleoside hydrolase [Pseudomonas coronafaciens pv. garcae]